VYIVVGRAALELDSMYSIHMNDEYEMSEGDEHIYVHIMRDVGEI
jgi:hypothetical protein